MGRAEAAQRRERRQDKGAGDHARQQVPEEDADRVRMGCVQDKGMLLLALQPPPDGGQEKEQDEGSGRHRQEDAVRDLVHSARRGCLPRLRGGMPTPPDGGDSIYRTL